MIEFLMSGQCGARIVGRAEHSSLPPWGVLPAHHPLPAKRTYANFTGLFREVALSFAVFPHPRSPLAASRLEMAEIMIKSAQEGKEWRIGQDVTSSKPD
jgi:hypothetical protein